MNWFTSVKSLILFLLLGNEQMDMEEWDDRRILERARKDWQVALKIFEETSDPELVEYAVYNLKAAEKRYSFLLGRLHNTRERTEEQDRYWRLVQ